LYDRHPIDEQNDIVTVMTVVGINTKLVDDFVGVLAPVLEVDQGVVERCAVIAGEAVAVTKGSGDRV